MSEKVTDIGKWLVGFSVALTKAGFHPAANAIKTAIGPEGNSGIGKVLSDYNSQHTLDLGDLKNEKTITLRSDVALSVTVNGNPVSIVIPAGLALPITDHNDMSKIMQGILIGAAITAGLALK